MPKAGFKSITISEIVYNRFYTVYIKNRDKLMMKGVNSFAGYITYMLEDLMKKNNTNLRYLPKLEKISTDDDRIVIKDNIKNRIIEVAFRNDEPYCLFCEKNSCFHIGFVFSIPDIYEILNNKGVKQSK